MSARRILNGTPGERWENTTGKVRFQLLVSWQNSCGRCIQWDRAISTSKWPTPFHRLCMCKQIPIYPGKIAQPFIDFREEIDKLPPHRRQHVIGKAALKLLEGHVLRWPDIVRFDRIKPLHELVSKHKLTVERMVAAGVDRRAAQLAFDRAHGHDAEKLAEAHRKAQEAEIAAKAEQRRQAKEAARARLAAREAKLAARPKRAAGPAPAERAARASAAHLARVQATTTARLRQAKVKLEAAHEAGLQARAEADLGLKFVAAPGAASKHYRTVVIDVGRVDADLAKHKDFYITPGGGGAAIEGRYEQFGKYHARAVATGRPVEMPRLAIGDATGDISVADGRHRLAWLRDHGATSVPVRVPKEDEAKIRQRYGYVPPAAEEMARLKAEVEARRPGAARAARKPPKLTAAEKRRLAREEAEAKAREEAERGLDAAQVALRRRMEAAPTQRDRFQVIHDWLRENHGPARPIREHGMADEEDLHRVEYGGRTYWIPPVPETYEPGAGHPLAYRIVAELQSPAERLPARLREATTEVIFTVQSNKDDEHWRKVYNNPNHASSATGAGGTVVVYRGEHLNAELDAHESGHNLAARIYGGTAPAPGGDYHRAIRSGEAPVSKYAANSDAEDFAESWKYYLRDRERMRLDHPERYAVIHRLATDPHYSDGGAVAGKGAVPARPHPAPVERSQGQKERTYADRQEQHVARLLGGKRLRDYEEHDVVIAGKKSPDGRTHAVEVKSLIKGEKRSLSVHENALLRKVEWQRANPDAVFHTVAIDRRAEFEGGKYKDNYSGHTLYYKRASGPYSLSKMYKVKDEDELKRLMVMPDSELPEEARGEFPKGKALEDLRLAAAKEKEYNDRRSRERKQKLKAAKGTAPAPAED